MRMCPRSGQIFKLIFPVFFRASRYFVHAVAILSEVNNHDPYNQFYNYIEYIVKLIEIIIFVSYLWQCLSNLKNLKLFCKVNVPVCEHVPVWGHLFIFFSINISNDKKPYDNLYKNFPGIMRNKVDMSCRC